MDTLKKISNELAPKKFELSFSVLAMIVGILIGFQIESCWQKYNSNLKTYTLLHFLYLESQFNVTNGRELFDCYRYNDSTKINIKLLEKSAAGLVLEDDNVFNILPNHKVSLLKSYIDALNTVNRLNDAYIRYISSRYLNDGNAKNIRGSLHKNIAAFLSNTYEIQGQFMDYFDKKLYNNSEIDIIETRIKINKEKILNNQFKTSKSSK